MDNNDLAPNTAGRNPKRIKTVMANWGDLWARLPLNEPLVDNNKVDPKVAKEALNTRQTGHWAPPNANISTRLYITKHSRLKLNGVSLSKQMPYQALEHPIIMRKVWSTWGSNWCLQIKWSRRKIRPGKLIFRPRVCKDCLIWITRKPTLTFLLKMRNLPRATWSQLWRKRPSSVHR